MQLLARPRRRRRSRSARRPAPTPARRSPTSARASTSSRRARASPRPGTRATRRRTRSAGRRWRRRTWRARSRSTCRRTRPRRRRRRRTALISELDAEQGHEPGHRLAEPAARTRSSAAAAGRHDAADDVDHLAGERRDRERHGHGLRERERQRRRQPRRALRRRRRSIGTDTTVAVLDRVEHDHGRRTAATALQTRAYDAAGNVGSSAVVNVTVEQRRRRRRADRERRLRGLGRRRGRSPGNAYWSTGGIPRTRAPATSILGAYNNASGTEYQTVTHPGGPSGEPHVLAQHHDERVPDDRVRLPLRRGAEHVRERCSARSARFSNRNATTARLVLAAVVQPREPGEARRSGSSSAATTDVDPADELPGRRRLAEVDASGGWAASAAAHPVRGATIRACPRPRSRSTSSSRRSEPSSPGFVITFDPDSL